MAANVDACAGNVPAEGRAPLRQVICGELAAVRECRAGMSATDAPAPVQYLTLFVCILVNVIAFLTRPDYFGLFIAASIYLNMYYFITLLVPTDFQKARPPAADLSKFHAWLKEIGIKSGVTQFTRLFINSIFINSRALSLGIGLIFSIDIVYALIYLAQGLPFWTTVVVIFQCAVIVVFYLLVWMVEPFSTSYIRKVERVKSSLYRWNLPPRLITSLFVAGFLLAIVLFLTMIILMPGFTVSAFLDQSNLQDLGNLVALLAILAVSQYFIIRYIHGITSRTMAERLFDYKENTLQALLAAEDQAGPGGITEDKTPHEMTALLLESKIFAVRRTTLAGFFPVFVVDLDFSVMMDSTTLTAIRGYIAEREHPE